MDTNQAADILGIKLPSELRIIKSAFRKLAMFAHPDVGGDAENFRQIEKAYRLLEANPDILKNKKEAIKETVDGISLETLGKGYPLNISAKTCANCEGHGYQILKEPRLIECKDCHGTGWKHVPCKRCKGSGHFKRSNKIVGKCYACNGTGEFVPYEWAKKNKKKDNNNYMPFFPFGFGIRYPPSYYCNLCDGKGQRYDNVGKSYAVVCDECKGIGEVKLFNPVLPRGLLR